MTIATVSGVGLTLDCADADRLADFYRAAFGYADQPVPAPFATRAEWVASVGDDPDEGGAWLCHPAGVMPDLFLQQVPEPRPGKLRLHLDVSLSGDPDWSRVISVADALVAIGATRLADFPGRWVVPADPEGNEFCLS